MTNSTNAKKSQLKGTHLRLVPYLDSGSHFKFDAIGYILFPGKTLHLGRFIDSFKVQNRVCFDSKAVSRGHADIWVEENGKCYIRDTKSTTGTFLDGKRLSPQHQSSKAFLLKHGDVVQLGMDYHENKKVVYRCVKMKIYLNSPSNEVKSKSTTSIKSEKNSQKKLDKCCICLNKMLPGESLFTTPCSHTFHSMCCGPILRLGFPAFVCPLCRSHLDIQGAKELFSQSYWSQ